MAMFFEILGWIGMGTFALCHLLLSFGWLKPATRYQCLQIFGAVCLGSSGLYAKFYQTTALETYWLCVSIYSIYHMRRYPK